MATDYTDPQAVQAVNSAADAFEKSVSVTEPVPQATEVPPPSPTEPPQTEQAQEAGSTPVAEAPVAPTPSLPPAGSEERRNLLAKFNGDEDAAAKAYWETNNRNAEMARKLAEYEAKYGKEGSTPPETVKAPAPVETPAELKRYDDKLRAVEGSYRTTQTEFGKFETEGKRLDREIDGIVRQLSGHDLTLDRDALTQKLTQAYQERAAIQSHLGALQDRLTGLGEKWEDLTHNKELAARLFAQERDIQEAREAKARTEEESVVQSYRVQFNSTIDKLTSDASIVPTILQTKAKTYVVKAVKAQLADGIPITDIDKFVRDEIADYLSGSRDFHSFQSSEYAKQKQADAALSAPAGPAAVASETKRPTSDWSKEQWEQHIANVQL